MADNTELNSMSGGVTVATDEIAGIHYQLVKLVNGTADATDRIPGEATNGLDVDVTRLPSLVAGSASIGVLGANSGVDIGDVTINNASGASAVNIQDGGNSITVDGTVVISDGSTSIAVLTGGQDDLVDSTNQLVTASLGYVFDGTTWDRLKGNSTDGMLVNLGTNNDVTNTGTFAVQSTNQANSGVDIGDVTINNGTGASAVNIQDGGNSITVDNGGTFATQATLQAGSSLVGDVSLQPRTANGCDIFRSLDLDETEEEVKASAGNVFGYYFHNKAATTMWLKFYNATAANVTVGTTTPVMTLGLPAGASGNVGLPYPVSFGTAISVAVTTAIADSDTGAPAANDVSINIFYK